MRPTALSLLLVLCISTSAWSQISPSKESLSDVYPGKAYSPYAERGFPSRPLWGDTHLHTGLSMDAGLFGCRLMPEDSYRLARGEQVMASSGQPVKLSRPLDWLVITDHSDGLGLIQDLIAGAPNVLEVEKGRQWNAGIKAGGQDAVAATLDLIDTFAQGKMPPELLEQYSPGSKKYSTVWERYLDTAEKYNEPGRFTALIGFEWTSLEKGNNLHRNVIFRDDSTRAKLVVPYTTQPPIGSTDPLDLYKWMEAYEKKTGGNVLALAHNGNLSNGHYQ